MTPKIIALVDGSIYSTHVCDHAAWFAQRTDAAVELLHVLGRRDGVGKQDLSGTVGLGARTSLLTDLAELDRQRSKLMMERGRAILDDARAIVDPKGAGAVTTQLRQGDIVESIAQVEAQARVILIGKRGEAAQFAKGHLGSNLERIVRACHRPVMVISHAFRPVKKVMVAWDGGASALKAVEHIARDNVFQGLEVQVVTVAQDSPETQQKLESSRAQLVAAGISADAAIIPGQPDIALSDHVEQAGFDMVVMGAYRHSRIRNLIIGSTTTAMLRTCDVPVMLIR